MADLTWDSASIELLKEEDINLDALPPLFRIPEEQDVSIEFSSQILWWSDDFRRYSD